MPKSITEQEIADIINDIKGVAEESKEEIAETPVEEKEITEIEGVEQAAEVSTEEKEAESKPEGQEPSESEDEDFKNLDPELREALSKADAATKKAQINAFNKMRANFDRKQTEFGQKKKFAETVEQTFTKYGLDVNNGLKEVENLIQFQRELKRNPKAAIEDLKTIFNVKDEIRAGSPEESIDEEAFDSNNATDIERLLYKQIQEANKKSQALEQELKKVSKKTELEEEQKYLNEILQVKNAKNQDGQPKNIYFDELLPEIEKLSYIYPNYSTQQLYDKALRLNDDIYNKSIQEVAEKERLKLAREREEALKKAKLTNSQSMKSSVDSRKNTSLEDIYDQILSKNNIQV